MAHFLIDPRNGTVDQIVRAVFQRSRTFARDEDFDGGISARRQADPVVEAKRQTQHVEAGAEIRAGGRDAHRDGRGAAAQVAARTQSDCGYPAGVLHRMASYYGRKTGLGRVRPLPRDPARTIIAPVGKGGERRDPRRARVNIAPHDDGWLTVAEGVK